MSKLLEQFIKEEYRSRTIPDFRVGDIVKVHQIVLDVKIEKKLSKTAKAIKKSKKDEKGPSQRVQVFEGVVIAKKHGTEPGATFTVRKIASHSVGVEKIFPLYSPLVKKIEVVSRPIKRVRQAKLYFLRERLGKRARRLNVGAAAKQERTEIGASAVQKAKIAEEERVVAEAKAAEEAEAKVEEKAIMEAPTPLEEGRRPDSSESSDDTEKK